MINNHQPGEGRVEKGFFDLFPVKEEMRMTPGSSFPEEKHEEVFDSAVHGSAASYFLMLFISHSTITAFLCYLLLQRLKPTQIILWSSVSVFSLTFHEGYLSLPSPPSSQSFSLAYLMFPLNLSKSPCNWYRLICNLFCWAMWISLSQAAALFISLSLGNSGTKCLATLKWRHTMPNKSLCAIRKALKGRLESLTPSSSSLLQHTVPIVILLKAVMGNRAVQASMCL